MSWLSRKDKLIFLIFILLSGFLAYYIHSFVEMKEENVIAFFSIVTGFLMTAIGLIYASNIRKVLYNTNSSGYSSSWSKLIAYYRFSIFYFIFLIFVYIVKIPVIPDVIYENIYLTVLFGGIYWLVKIFDSLFYLLSVEVNGK